jgi:CheY-like chemotaxis protein
LLHSISMSRDARDLSAFLSSKRALVVRKWERVLKAWGQLRPGELERDLAPLIDELAEVLHARDVDAPQVFGAIAGPLGAKRFDAGLSLRDSCRTIALLEDAVLAALSRPPPIPVARLLSACVSEAVAQVAAEHARAGGLSQARVAESALRQAIDLLHEGVLVYDADGAVGVANRAVEVIFGKPGRALADPGVAHAAVDALRSGAEVGETEQRVRNQRSDEERDVRISAHPLTDAAGAVVIARDVTEERRLERELERLDRETTSLHARLLRVGHEKSMADLAAGTALALNNELNALALSVQLVRGEKGPDAARHLEAIEAAVRRSAHLVARLQELAAPPAPSAPRAIDLNEAILEALDLVRPELTAAATERSIRVDAHLTATRPVLAPGPELRELLCKLLLAARDELPAGGVLELRTRDQPGHAELTITHAANAQTAEDRLLLDAIGELARKWGATLQADERDQVRTLRVDLPVASAEAKPPPAPRRAGPLRVLVVDDDAGNRETLSELLGLSGYEVDDAATADEALRAVERRPYAAALVDLAMPGMNGIELARRLRARHPEVRIALVTGWEPSRAAEASDVVDAVFRKPIDLAAIDAFLSQSATAHG